jgi:hypothetical protein
VKPHAPVHATGADINAFCPRDYAAEALADRLAKHAAGSSSAAAGSTRGGASDRQQQQQQQERQQQQRAAASGRAAATRSSSSTQQGDFRLDDQLRHYRKRDGSVGYR